MTNDTAPVGARDAVDIDLTRTIPAIGTSRIRAICDLNDDLYRNRQITHAYAGISDRLALKIDRGERINANWFTFARWSSFTVGENLRLDQPSRAFDEFLSGHAILWPVRSTAIRVQRDLRMLSDAAMPRILALGNQLVFHEIAWSVADFLQWCDDNPGATPAVWAAYRDAIEPEHDQDLFPSCEVEWLRGGIDAYYRAMHEDDPIARARLVLHGNVMLAAYEQWRLEPIVQIALDPIAKHLVAFKGTDIHNTESGEPRAVLRRRGTPWALVHRSRINRWIADVYAVLLTRYVMAWEGPVAGHTGSLFLGRGVRDVPGQLPCAPGLDDATDPELLVVRMFDRSDAGQGSRAAVNWARYADRMNFIVNLFRSQQTQGALFAPIPPDQVRVVDLDLSDARLDDLREVCDPLVDAAIEAHSQHRDLEPRALVRELASQHFAPIDAAMGDQQLPAWANPEQMLAGQEFFREHGLEIGSALYFAALPMSYTAARGARVLTRTAELTTGDTGRRLAETGKMLLDLMKVEPKGTLPLEPGTMSHRAVHGVRLYHGAVRHMILNDPAVHWDRKQLGEPINQEDLLGTLIVFTVVVVDALETMGVDFGNPQMIAAREAYVHYWLVVGHLLGIRYGDLRFGELGPSDPPLNLEELRLLQTSIFRRQAATSVGGQTLTGSLLSTLKRGLPTVMKGYPAAAMRTLIGEEYADVLGIPAAGPGRLIFDAVRVTTRLFSPRAPGRGLAALARMGTQTLYGDWIDTKGGGDPPWRVEIARELGFIAPADPTDPAN